MQNSPQMRPIRSFVRREGRMTKTQSKALASLWPYFGLEMDEVGFINAAAIFGNLNPVTLEIGFGDGRSLVEMALKASDKNFIGIEVYRTGVGNLLAAVESNQLQNIRVYCADALEVLEQKIADNSLTTVQIFFADPWPKSRHHKRRLIQPEFMDLLAKKLIKGGILHLATDWMDYAYQMMSVLSNADHFVNEMGVGNFMPRPECRPLTKYEQRGINLGHQTWDLMFKKMC